MAERGDVLRLKRRLGFGTENEEESVVVVQASDLNSVLPTLLVVPLDPALPVFRDYPAALRVPARECGSSADHVALPTEIRSVRADRFAPGRAGRLRVSTLNALDGLLRLVLDL